MIKNPKLLMVSFIISIIFASPKTIHAMDRTPIEEGGKFDHFKQLSPEIQEIVIKKTVFEECYNSGHATNLILVCTDWYYSIKEDRPSKLPFYDVPHNLEESCLLEIFLNGNLIYTSENGEEIELRIADLKNPLEGTFDLSKCGITGKYLSISTGYRKGMNPENTDKVEIWFVPRLLLKKLLKNGKDHQFKDIMEDGVWEVSESIGIFWTWGNWDHLCWHDGLLHENFDQLSDTNLHEKWLSRNVHIGTFWNGYKNSYINNPVDNQEFIGLVCSQDFKLTLKQNRAKDFQMRTIDKDRDCTIL